MADAARRFEWHPQARLMWRGREISRPTGHAPADAPLAVHLAHALTQGIPFLIAADPELRGLAEGSETGTFFTLTGGTTSAPKVIRRSCASWLDSFAVNARLFDCEVHDTIAVLGDLSHSLALYGTVEALHLGMDTHVLEGLSAPRQWRQVANQNVTAIYATPSQLHLLAKAARGTQNENMRLILCGGGALSATTRSMIEKAFPAAAIREFYGAAETSFITMTRDDTPPGSVGPAYPGTMIEIRNPEGVPTTDTGTVWVAGPYLFDGYASGLENAHLDASGYVSVGEIGRLDEDGNLFLQGRADRRFTVADHSLQPEILESALSTLDGLSDCAVLPVPDGARGHRPMVVLEAMQDATLPGRVRDCCAQSLGAWAIPQEVHLTDTFPRLPSGKPDLQSLARRFGVTA